LTKDRTFRHQYFWDTNALHEFFDKVLKTKNGGLCHHLAEANFDPEFFTSYEKEIQNNLLTNSLVQKNNIT
jgi:hypothetical protein